MDVVVGFLDASEHIVALTAHQQPQTGADPGAGAVFDGSVVLIGRRGVGHALHPAVFLHVERGRGLRRAQQRVLSVLVSVFVCDVRPNDYAVARRKEHGQEERAHELGRKDTAAAQRAATFQGIGFQGFGRGPPAPPLPIAPCVVVVGAVLLVRGRGALVPLRRGGLHHRK